MLDLPDDRSINAGLIKLTKSVLRNIHDRPSPYDGGTLERHDVGGGLNTIYSRSNSMHTRVVSTCHRPTEIKSIDKIFPLEERAKVEYLPYAQASKR